MIGKICLIEFDDKKVRPVLIVREDENNLYVSKLRPKSLEKNKNVIYVGKPEGLRNESVAMAGKIFSMGKEKFIKEISKVDTKIVNKVINMNNKIEEIRSLHSEIHVLKNKILLAQMNNSDYHESQERLDYILQKLEYQPQLRRSEKGFRNFREVPIKGHIKIYFGGR